MQLAASGLEKIVINSFRRVSPEEAPLLAWPLVCGSLVAERTRATAFSAGVLQVEVSDAGWRDELKALAQRYVANLNRYSQLKVERIELTVRPTLNAHDETGPVENEG